MPTGKHSAQLGKIVQGESKTQLVHGFNIHLGGAKFFVVAFPLAV